MVEEQVVMKLHERCQCQKESDGLDKLSISENHADVVVFCLQFAIRIFFNSIKMRICGRTYENHIV